MNKLAFVSTLAAASMASTVAVAGPRYHTAAPPPAYHGSQAFADVMSSVPIYRTVRVEEPRRECWDERVVYEDRRSQDYWFDNGVAGGVVGAIAGGIAGHQFGKGRGKDAATVLGAVIGAGVGQRVAVQNTRRDPGYQRVGYEERCQTVTKYRTEQRIDAYDVTYRFGGQTYQTTLPYDPGARLAVDVSVRPLSQSYPVSY